MLSDKYEDLGKDSREKRDSNPGVPLSKLTSRCAALQADVQVCRSPS